MTNVQYPSHMMDYHRTAFQAGGYPAVQRKPAAVGHGQPFPTAYPQQSQHFTHSRSRTTSSNVLPHLTASPTYSSVNQPSPTYGANAKDPSRRLSSATTSTTSTGGQVTRSGTSASSNIQRSSSSRSSSAGTSYVALMRKQKATVWCDRSQHQDPRVAAQQRAAKERAAREIHGGGRVGTFSSSTYSGKIRHGPKGASYGAANMSGAGVPVRLSANEVGEGEDEDDAASGRLHQRSGSGRSSLNSNKHPNVYQRVTSGRFSTSSSPPGDSTSPADETPVPLSTRVDYFDTSSPHGGDSGGSGTPERENSFGEIKEMTGPNAIQKAAETAKKAEELRRRGSVDDRSMTLSGVRLFVANPDLSD